ncbi:DUF6011 domain-containing protein [Lysinibacillus sp. FSL W8-0953]|uniref:DUF6011 domain-containing protein n=1 Tax=Lysinibacillus sp. FSL W8-0953 TaxID=2954640 RepID=UPI0030F8B205
MSRCKRCNRPLKSGESIIRRYGATCWQRHLDDLEEEYLKNQLTIYDLLEMENQEGVGTQDVS